MKIIIILVSLLISVAYGCIPINTYFYETQVPNEPEKIFVVDRRFFRANAVNAGDCKEYKKVCDYVYLKYQIYNDDNDFQVLKEGRLTFFKTKKFLVVVAKAPNTKEP